MVHIVYALNGIIPVEIISCFRMLHNRMDAMIVVYRFRKNQGCHPFTCFYSSLVESMLLVLFWVWCLSAASISLLWHVSIGMNVNTLEMGVWRSRYSSAVLSLESLCGRDSVAIVLFGVFICSCLNLFFLLQWCLLQCLLYMSTISNAHGSFLFLLNKKKKRI